MRRMTYPCHIDDADEEGAKNANEHKPLPRMFFPLKPTLKFIHNPRNDALQPTHLNCQTIIPLRSTMCKPVVRISEKKTDSSNMSRFCNGSHTALSIPNMISMRKKSRDQKFAPGRVPTASGYTSNTKPGPTKKTRKTHERHPSITKYPRKETVQPAANLRSESPAEYEQMRVFTLLTNIDNLGNVTPLSRCHRTQIGEDDKASKYAREAVNHRRYQAIPAIDHEKTHSFFHHLFSPREAY